MVTGHLGQCLPSSGLQRDSECAELGYEERMRYERAQVWSRVVESPGFFGSSRVKTNIALDNSLMSNVTNCL